MKEENTITSITDSIQLINCRLGIETASFACIREAPSNCFGNPVFIDERICELINSINMREQNMILPRWCMSDLVEIIQFRYPNRISILCNEKFLFADMKSRLNILVNIIKDEFLKSLSS